MSETTLVIMAAGMGSRFGGMKQIAPVDEQGHIIIDFSVYDAIRAGFGRVVFVIKEENEPDFRSTVGARFAGRIPVFYAHQALDALPRGAAIPAGRTRPWGTAHAVLCTEEFVPGDFAVINADDFYGADAITKIASFLSRPGDDHAMVAYELANTLTDKGSVNRGICSVTEDGFLSGIAERLGIFQDCGGGRCEIDGRSVFLPGDIPASMNLFGFRHSIFDAIHAEFLRFLTEEVPENPLKAECYLPTVPNNLIRDGKARLRVLSTSSKWYGVTYREDLPDVRRAIERLKSGGEYPIIL